MDSVVGRFTFAVIIIISDGGCSTPTTIPTTMEEDNISNPPENGETRQPAGPRQMSISSEEVNYLIYRYVDWS